MKVLWMVLIAFTLSFSDEIQRVDDMLQDISKLRADYQKSQNKIAQLEEIIQKQKQFSAKKIAPKPKVKTITKEIFFSKCEAPNPFPKLMMKEDNKIYSFKASAFRANKSASIYSGLNGDVIKQWEKNTSFTSDTRTDSMIKITGYFVNRAWTASTKDMWIKAQDATKR